MRDALIERFFKYVQIDSQSDPESAETPSTSKQWELARLLARELEEIGLSEVRIDENAYVTATLPSNCERDVPVIGFISHFDTSPDFSGTGVRPRLVRDYDGGSIVLNKEAGLVLSPEDFPELNNYKGQTLVVTDGNTLLGADDKAGIAEIVTAMSYLLAHPELRHGKVRIGFTPDEEIGRGAKLFPVENFGADWAYTMDGSGIGELQFENFNAAKATIRVQGKSVHPGFAKGKMINAISVLNTLLAVFPKAEVPERTSGRDGFYHVHRIEGNVETARAELIIRDHDRAAFEARKEKVRVWVSGAQWDSGTQIALEMEDQYYNMREKIQPVYPIVRVAEEAMHSLGIEPVIKPIRGGTDGSQLSFMGLPCPNIFAGGHNFHGKYEYVPVESMEKAVAVIVKICELTALKPAESWKRQAE